MLTVASTANKIAERIKKKAGVSTIDPQTLLMVISIIISIARFWYDCAKYHDTPTRAFHARRGWLAERIRRLAYNELRTLKLPVTYDTIVRDEIMAHISTMKDKDMFAIANEVRT